MEFALPSEVRKVIMCWHMNFVSLFCEHLRICTFIHCCCVVFSSGSNINYRACLHVYVCVCMCTTYMHDQCVWIITANFEPGIRGSYFTKLMKCLVIKRGRSTQDERCRPKKYLRKIFYAMHGKILVVERFFWHLPVFQQMINEVTSTSTHGVQSLSYFLNHCCAISSPLGDGAMLNLSNLQNWLREGGEGQTLFSTTHTPCFYCLWEMKKEGIFTTIIVYQSNQLTVWVNWRGFTVWVNCLLV